MKKIYKLFSILFILVTPLFTYFSYCVWGDLLYDIFQWAREKNTVIDLWDNKSDVWHTVLRESRSYSIWTWFYENAPLIVKLVKLILWATVVLSVTMVIYYGVKFMVQVFGWNDYKSASAKKDLINLFIWLLIALFSITAVTLVISIPKSSL